MNLLLLLLHKVDQSTPLDMKFCNHFIIQQSKWLQMNDFSAAMLIY